MKQKSIFLCFFLTFLVLQTINAQSISGIINAYARITSIDTCDMRFAVTDTVGFKKGMRVLIIQMNGATINSSNSSSYGSIESLNNVGRYEINVIDDIQNKNIFLGFYLKNQYNENAIVQIVSFPSYADAIVTDTLRAKPWNGESGGIIAFEANNLTLNAPIDASGAGFRGGGVKAYANCDALENYPGYFYALTTTDKTNGGLKGEGIAAFILGKECGRGAQANGGGGGNNHKSGGGGGGHLVAGGIGGEQKHVNDLRNCVGKFPGLEGKAINGLGNDRLIFGGGGGAGHNKESSNNKGGDGGGIVFIKTNSLTANGNEIIVNGEDSEFSDSDGAGGGGAAGTIVLLANQHNGSIVLEANGGNGGNTGSISEYDFGPGGGGAGGRIITKIATGVTTSLIGGNFGKNFTRRSSQGAAKATNGIATNAANFSVPTSVDTISRVLNFVEQPQTKRVCEFQATTLSVKAKGVKLTYEWQVHRGDDRGFMPIVSDTTFIGVNTPTLILNRVRTTLNPYLFRCMVKSECSSVQEEIKSDPVGLVIIPAPIATFTPNIAYNTVSFTNGTSNATGYLWDFGNGQTSTATNPTYTYPVQGNYNVVLKSVNSCDTNTYTLQIKINALPKANFTAITSDYCLPSSVRFTNLSSNNVVSYQWLFPSGTPATSTDLNPSVIYQNSGVYDVYLIVSNGNGKDTLKRSSFIRVNGSPIAKFDITRAPNSTTATFLNRTEGASSYKWDFGDGTTSVDAAPQHTYRSTGIFVVCLIASNACGLTSTCDTLTLLSLPSAQISVNQTVGCAPLFAQFSGQNPSNVISWAWSFPGGTPTTSTERNPRVTYAASGVYTVTLRVSNAAGIKTTVLDSFVRVQPSPIVKFSVVSIDSTVATFENFSSSATVYRWDFGDGTGSEEFNPPPHTYYRNGNYTVTLQALNNACGGVTTQKVPIFVVGTDEAESANVSLFPNPTNGKWTLDFKTPLATVTTMVVSNLRGQIVKTIKLQPQNNQEFDFGDLTNGVYFLRFTNEHGNFVKKLIKI
ncbi:MAG: PKD domain-containing protein [Saprospiraceae bacterium]|nr:PKD domain-containing protein [Saprospiraceae bacterium]